MENAHETFRKSADYAEASRARFLVDFMRMSAAEREKVEQALAWYRSRTYHIGTDSFSAPTPPPSWIAGLASDTKITGA